MVIHHYKQKLAIARPGDTSWITVDTPYDVPYVDVIIYKEQFYAVNLFGMLVVCDIDITSKDALHRTTPKATVVMEKWLDQLNHHRQIYLVEWMGELLLVLKFLQNFCKNMTLEEWRRKQLPFYKTETFSIYKLDFAKNKWEEVNGLGEYCLFLGNNTSVSILANASSLKKNCIYFTDNFTTGYRGSKTPGGLDMGVFDLEDKNNRFYPEGTHLMIPWFDRPVVYDVRARPHLVESTSGSRDLQMVMIAIGLRVLTRPVADRLPTIYRTLGENYNERILPSIIHETLKAVVAQYNASQLITCSGTTLPRETSLLPLKQRKLLRKKRAKFVVEKAEQDKKGAVIRAQANSAQLIGQAIANNPVYITLRKIKAAREIAQTIAMTNNCMFLSSDDLVLNLKDMNLEPIKKCS
ncbi:Prohibitin-2 protein [Thalictrum thalictroides]|uniref:Prohibitin-2 protein n=1 Tax=Thalictrum thalictroides TaxID=46969 RepID=A0A7J6WDU9_THATH|nr:Prohibitin-2 protein [Thalictrum thalictroides]